MFSYSQDRAHNVRGGSSQFLAELIKVFKVRFVEFVPENLDIHLIQIVLILNTLREEGCEGRVHHDRVEQLCGALSDGDGREFLELSQRVAPGKELSNRPVTQGSCYQQDDVVDHVPGRE